MMKKVFAIALTILFFTPGLIFAESLGGGSNGAGTLSTGGIDSSAMETSPSGGGGQRGTFPFVKITASQTQPASSVAPRGAVVPFTTFDVLSNVPVFPAEITIERQGISTDAAFQEVMLIANASPGISDSNAGRIIAYGTLNPVTHRAILYPLNLGFLTAGRYTVAAMVSRNNPSIAGQVAKFAVMGAKFVVENRGFVPATMTSPVVGASQSIIESLSVGTLLVWKNADGVLLQAGSAEDLVIQKIALPQTGGSVSVNGASYSCVFSRYPEPYRDVCNFNPPLVLGKGRQVVIVPRSRHVFIPNIHDVVARGVLYGYQILPVANPVIVETGTLQVSVSPAVPSQNIVVNVPNQPLGRFAVDVRNESISVRRMVFRVALGSNPQNVRPYVITNVTIVDENAFVVAGPVDTAPDGSITFTDRVVFPLGSHTYSLLGKIQPTVNREMTVTLSTTPANDLTSALGSVSGNTIIATPASPLTFPTMTVKVGALRVTNLAFPPSQTITAGTQGFTFANYSLDATESAEDIRITSLPLEYSVVSGNAADLTGCSLYDGATALTTGSNTVNPTQTGKGILFQLDGAGLAISRGTSKVIALKCNTDSVAQGSYAWGLDADQTATFTGAVGVVTGQVIQTNFIGDLGQFITTVNAGKLHISLDSSTSVAQYAIAGLTGQVVSVLKLHAEYEPVLLQQIVLNLAPTAVSTDVVRVTLWDISGQAPVGIAVFQGLNTRATSTLSGSFIIPKDGDKLLVVEADLATLGPNNPSSSGHLISINVDPNLLGTVGVGQSSGMIIHPSDVPNTSAPGRRLVKTIPRLHPLPIPSNTLMNGESVLYRFSATASPAGDVGLAKLKFQILKNGSVIPSNFKLYAYSDPGFALNAYAQNPIHSRNVARLGEDVWGNAIDQNSIAFYFNPLANTNPNLGQTVQEAIEIPASQTRYFELRGTMASSTQGDIISIGLEGDNGLADDVGTIGQVNALTLNQSAHNDFLWSPNTLNISAVSTADWFNGYQLPGLPSTVMATQVMSK